MGSSSYNNLNPFPCFPPPSTTSYNLPLSLPSVLLNSDPSPNNTTTFNFHQPHQDPVSFLAPYFPIGHFSALTPPEAAVINFAVAGNNIQALGDIVPSAPGAGTGMGKKDRHSKIYTAQGLRDRRVRLSIDIARKFFDLQDMLGYDKASKTLEWLFSKSKKAIKELSNAKYGNVGVHGGTKNMSLAASDVEEEEEEEDDDKVGWGLKMKSMLSIDEEIKEQEKVSKKVEVFNLLAKESRAKARARARERTMEKKQVGDDDDNGKIYGHQKTGTEEVSDHHWISKHLNQSTETSNLSTEESSFMNKRKVICAKKFIDDNDNDEGVKPCRDDNAGISQWKLLDQMKGSSKGHLQEPSMIKRKWRPSIISGSSQRNLLISIDGIPINLTQNWDTNSNPNYPFAK